MFYDTLYRHNQALTPDPNATVMAAFHALTSAVEDCRRAGKRADQDAATLLLVRSLADSIERSIPDVATLIARCTGDRESIIAHPALLAIAGHSVGNDPVAKRTFHAQARRALTRAAEALGLAMCEVRIVVMPGTDHDDGITELRHADLCVRVVPRGFLPDSEVAWFRCVRGEPAGRSHHGGAALLLDPHRFAAALDVVRDRPTPLAVAA